MRGCEYAWPNAKAKIIAEHDGLEGCRLAEVDNVQAPLNARVYIHVRIKRSVVLFIS